jgi:hypothetical protein
LQDRCSCPVWPLHGCCLDNYEFDSPGLVKPISRDLSGIFGAGLLAMALLSFRIDPMIRLTRRMTTGRAAVGGEDVRGAGGRRTWDVGRRTSDVGRGDDGERDDSADKENDDRASGGGRRGRQRRGRTWDVGPRTLGTMASEMIRLIRRMTTGRAAVGGEDVRGAGGRRTWGRWRAR